MKIKISLALMLISVRLFAQQNVFSLQEAIDHALKNNSSLRAVGYEVESQRQLKKTSVDLPKTDVTVMYGQYNSYAKNDNNITVSQAIPFSVFGSQAKLNKAILASSEWRKAYSENELVFQIKKTYNDIAYAYSVRELLLQRDSIFERFYRSASVRYRAGETKLLEQTTAEAQRHQSKVQLRENETQLAIARSQLKRLLNTSVSPDIADKKLVESSFMINFDTALISSNPSLAYMLQQVDVADKQRKIQSAKAAPDLLIGFFSQTLVGALNPETGTIANNSERFTGFQIGLSLPLWVGPHQGRIRAAEFNRKAVESNYQSYRQSLRAELDQAFQEYQTTKGSLEYYQRSALPNADLILKQSQAAFKGGDIDYSEFLLGLKNALEIKDAYLQTLRDYNQSIIQIEFLSGNK
jgi:outer membrane protein TolC